MHHVTNAERIQSLLRSSEILGDCLPKARRLALGLALTAAPQLVESSIQSACARWSKCVS
jgi:hypothetical protein